MKPIWMYAITIVSLGGCAHVNSYNPLDDYVELDAVTILEAPDPGYARVAPENREAVTHGKYLVELLGCGTCHTDGALLGMPQNSRAMAGSGVGIAYTNPLANDRPGIVFAPNLTPDNRTGIGLWTEQQIIDAVRVGQGRHGNRRILVMPWQGYAKLSENDVRAIAGYLQSLAPVEHLVPEDVPIGRRTSETFVHFGVYQSRQ